MIISKAECKALYARRQNKEVVVLRADKGNATVRLNKSEYQAKLNGLLDKPAYQKISKDPTGKIERKVNSLVKPASLPLEVQKLIVLHSFQPLRFYGLPKIHKMTVPLHPIVSSIKRPTYGLGKYLSKMLKALVGSCEHHVKDSYTVVGEH